MFLLRLPADKAAHRRRFQYWQRSSRCHPRRRSVAFADADLRPAVEACRFERNRDQYALCRRAHSHSATEPHFARDLKADSAAEFLAGQCPIANFLPPGAARFPFPVDRFPGLAFNFPGESTGSTHFDGWGGGASDLSSENRFHFADTVSITRGRRNLKTGGDIRRNRYDNLRGNPFFGQFIFGSILSSSSDMPGSGAPFADYLMGFPSLIQATQMLDWGRQRHICFGA